MTKDKLIVEVDCEFRNNVGACSAPLGSSSCHCLHCPFGSDWISKHVHVLFEDTDAWGKDATNELNRPKSGENPTWTREDCIKNDCGHMRKNVKHGTCNGCQGYLKRRR